MATILKMVQNRLPDEAEIFADSVLDFIEENQAKVGLDGINESELSTLQKSLIADKTAKNLILPAMSRYKKDLKNAEGEGSGTAEWVDKLNFLKQMKKDLEESIQENEKSVSGTITDRGVAMKLVE
ncbi:MAG: hypothetical protein GY714_10485 [Desulfobacterales bacterium]|nr:hypothetical protein [Desulfobacterales bacterium]